MKPDSQLAVKISGKEFIFTAEYLPPVGTEVVIDSKVFGAGVAAVNIADNHFGVSLSSLAASVAFLVWPVRRSPLAYEWQDSPNAVNSPRSKNHD